ncbi:hypothetical protein Bbelb_442590 [Branchiostoma belcheri]|nr:hypothetical protein Bbelb_442590 [Branchiostoma belcheri]
MTVRTHQCEGTSRPVGTAPANFPPELCRESCGRVQRVSSRAATEGTPRTQAADLPDCGRKMETVGMAEFMAGKQKSFVPGPQTAALRAPPFVHAVRPAIRWYQGAGEESRP